MSTQFYTEDQQATSQQATGHQSPRSSVADHLGSASVA